MKNPPIVAPLDENGYVILDGANRCYSFAHIDIPHILVQVVSYASGQVDLGTWNHVVSRWNADELMRHVTALDGIQTHHGSHKNAIAHIHLRDNRIVALLAPVDSIHQRNAALRDFVRIYQRNAVLSRTPLHEPKQVWHLYSEANALVVFPTYTPQHILEAARHKAYLPPGISRHIVQGRALQVNYPMATLRDTTTPINQKNAQLQAWITEKLMNRRLRYYAEATYLFNE